MELLSCFATKMNIELTEFQVKNSFSEVKNRHIIKAKELKIFLIPKVYSKTSRRKISF